MLGGYPLHPQTGVYVHFAHKVCGILILVSPTETSTPYEDNRTTIYIFMHIYVPPQSSVLEGELSRYEYRNASLHTLYINKSEADSPMYTSPLAVYGIRMSSQIAKDVG